MHQLGERLCHNLLITTSVEPTHYSVTNQNGQTFGNNYLGMTLGQNRYLTAPWANGHFVWTNMNTDNKNTSFSFETSRLYAVVVRKPSQTG